MSQPLDDLMGNSLTEPIQDSMDDTNVVVDIVDDRPEEDRVSPRDDGRSEGLESEDEELKSLGGRAGKRINQLKYEYHEERRNKEAAVRMQEEAVRYAQSVEHQNRELRDVLERGEKVLLSEIHSRTDGQLTAAKERYKQAYESGDSDAIVDAQEELNRSVIDSTQASQYQPVVEQQNEEAYMQQQMVMRQAAMQRQQMAQMAARRQPVDPKLQSWMQDNEWFGKDPEKTQFAFGVHEKLVKQDGVDPRSDEYYQKINARMGEVFPGMAGGVGSEDPAGNSRTTTVVAPAQRSSGPPRRVQLTSTQKRLAERLGITPVQYAEQLMKEARNG